MHAALVMTIIGPDRPGLVEAVAEIVAAQGGNWLESRMARLGGQFAGILRVEVPEENKAAMVQSLNALETKGLKVTVSGDSGTRAATGRRTMALELVGHDRPGIVRQITRTLASQGVNVEELETECVSAPMSGETLFKARAALRIPEGCQEQDLRAELEKIAADLIVDITFDDAVR